MKKKIHKIETDYSSFGSLFLGILSSDIESKLCWSINDKININLIETEKNGRYFYSFENEYSYKLISNREKQVYVFSELKNIDYILIVTGENISDKKKDIISKLKNINEIISILEINHQKLKKCKKELLNF